MAVSAGCAAAQTVSQAPGIYLQANLGSGVGGNTHISLAESGVGSGRGDFNPKAGVFASVAAGKSYRNGLAAEVEGIYTRNDIDAQGLGATVTAYGVLANLMYAVGRVGPIVPYVGAGAGFGGVRYSLPGASKDDNGLMWQVRAGASVPVTPKVSLDFGYRYLGTPNFKAANDTAYVKFHTELHVLSGGVRVRF